MTCKKMFIDGEWVLSESGKTFDVINPATGEKIAEVTKGNRADVQKAVAAPSARFMRTAGGTLRPRSARSF